MAILLSFSFALVPRCLGSMCSFSLGWQPSCTRRGHGASSTRALGSRLSGVFVFLSSPQIHNSWAEVLLAGLPERRQLRGFPRFRRACSPPAQHPLSLPTPVTPQEPPVRGDLQAPAQAGPSPASLPATSTRNAV